MVTSAKFRSRARVIDLLGRQQIGDAPTAVGELLKNSLDAAATEVVVNYEEDAEIFQFTDNGLGMRPEDVTDKWLVLATDSSLNRSQISDGWQQFATDDQKKYLGNPSYGEKGIGRLSIAMLGRMTLLWSVWGEESEAVGTLCLVHWHLFQHPRMLFDDLSIPMLELSKAPTKKNIEALFAQLKNDPAISKLVDDQEWDEVLREELKGDLEAPWAEILGCVSLDFKMGTSFVALKADEQVEVLFDKRRTELKSGEEYPPDYLKSYHAFSTFWDPFHEIDGRPFNIEVQISGKQRKSLSRYWQPSDFKDCDHHIRIEVTKDGFAKGFIKNYGQEVIEYQLQLQTQPRNHHSPGPFLVEIGYVQGKQNTWLPADIHQEINLRLIHAGGFSIYLDRVRIQPYGAIDSDFAGFEQRRLKNAGRYYFSTLRIFGGVFLPSKKDTSLREKAGREGFVVNGARRGLRLWLEQLFVDIADQHLGTKADRKDKAEAKEKKARAAAGKRLKEEEQEYLEKIKLAKGWLNDYQTRVMDELKTCRQHLSAESNSEPGTYLSDCDESIDRLRKLQDDLAEGTPGEAPDGVVLEGDVLADVDAYLTKRDAFKRDIRAEIGVLQKERKPLADRVKSKEESVRHILTTQSNRSSTHRQKIDEAMAPAYKKAEQITGDLDKFVRKEFEELEKIRDEYLDGLKPEEIVSDQSGEKLVRFEQALARQSDELDDVVIPRIRRLVSELEHLTDNSSKSVLLSEQGKLIEALKERVSFLAEMAQLGLVLESANHEYENQVLHVRSAIRSLRRHLNKSGAEFKTLTTLSDSFEIIDQRIRLFDPLVRRRAPNRDNLTGAEIHEFIERRIKIDASDGYNVKFTSAFDAIKWQKVQRPIILGAVHNIFLNALYWAKQGKGTGDIRFSAAGNGIVISNSGPGVVERDQDRLFEPGFTRRPYGRGLGLYVAKEALNGIGFVLNYSSVPELGALEGANFIIAPKE